ncbi:MAG: efflux RND transporter periplasmic adaptor subunit [Planctomycetes bacterium]|nr:efflux RND transporter periplasmic adaptor subunit [Planctomycetota bacterium]MBI3843195.1 efflux RND transporter periplasmic adaptor subunit [Planctomycetota bacterium]
MDSKPDAGKEASADEITLVPAAVAKYGFATEPARKRTLTTTVTAPARISFNVEAMANVGSVVRGRILEIKAKRGDLVKAGDVLLVIESSELGEAQSDYLQKRNAVALAGPAIELAKDSAERARSLYEENKGIALGEVLKREGEYKAAQGVLRSAESGLQSAENRLHLLGMSHAVIDTLAKTGEIDPRYVVTAPIEGTVVDEHVVRGDLVGPDHEVLFVLADMGTLWAVASVPEGRLADVIVGSKARVKLAAVGRAIDGVVSLIDPALDPDTRTARVRIDVHDAAIRPGMTALAEILVPTANAEPVLAVPEEAVQTVAGKPAVFVPVAGKQNTFAKRSILVGLVADGWLPVLGGLEEGDAVVVKSSFVLKAELTKGSEEE